MRDALALTPTPSSGENNNSIGNTQTTAPANNSNIVYASSSSDVDIEKQRSSATTSDHDDIIHDHVDIQYAEKQFADLKRRYSNLSRVASHTSQRSRKRLADAEKSRQCIASEPESEEEFDLEDVLRDRHRKETEHDIKPKHLGVVFEDLTVKGFGGAKYYIKTFPNAFIDFFNVYGTLKNLFGKKKGIEFDILKDFTGCVRPGEMLLVLGAPGSGCTTFLRVMANQRSGYTDIKGNVEYGGIDAKTFAKLYRGEAVYNQEDDTHFPTLTVGQTLNFALDTKIPKKRLPGESKSQFKRDVINTLLKMYNIEHTKNTLLGGSARVRGVSGGERKRVSIAEMMISRGSICCWDNTTRGLDSSTALDFAKSLRVMTDIYKLPTLVSLYQASESIYSLFDKVLVIDHGKQVYFGPANEARAYFEGLGFAPKPRQTTPDYLTGCTDPWERDFAEGWDTSTIPQTSEDLEKAYKSSGILARMREDKDAYKAEVTRDSTARDHFRSAVLDAKHPFTPKKSVYSIPFHQQTVALFKRQFRLKMQDWFTLATSWITTMLVAILVGTLFYDLPATSAGAFTRGGVLFISLLFNALQAFAEVGTTLMGRPILNKHQAFAFHRPAALWVAQIWVDIPFAAFNIFCFSLFVYFMTGLYRDAGTFFVFYLFVLIGYVCLSLFFRTIGVICPDFDYALKFASVTITLMILTGGYQIPYNYMPWWVRWFFWVNPLAYDFSSLMSNEFTNVNLTCAGNNLVPSGPTYTDIANQVCTLQGAVTGTDLVVGADYISRTFNYFPKDTWRNFGIILAFTIVFLVLNGLLSEVILFGASGRTITFFQKENKERKTLNDALAKKRSERKRGESSNTDTEKLYIESERVLTWEALNYDVPVKGKKLRLLNDIYGFVRPGELTALMGASGAGKTTLLDVLANRKNVGVITGDVLIDAKPRGIEFQRGTAYCEQIDVHEDTQTVREALRFSAYLRQPKSVSKEEKDEYVEQVIALLEMEAIADAEIGNTVVGLSVAERKRVTIGVELAAKPELLLFLDEPSSGLDSQSAYNIVRFLRKLAQAGQAILCTIHQPNDSLFEQFDRLLLLQRGGRTVYFGEIGEDASVLRDYFKRNGAECPPRQNPAEFMLEAIGAGSRPRVGDRDWADIWADSQELVEVKKRITQIKEERAAADLNLKMGRGEYATPLLYQVKVVLRRMNMTFWRSPNYGFTRIYVHVVVAFFTGVTFWQVGHTALDLQNRIFVIFQATILPAFLMMQVEPRYDFSRLIFIRENSSKMYSQFAFVVASVVAEIPYGIIAAVMYFICFYFPAGFNLDSDRAGYQFLMILLTEFFSITLGLVVAAITPNAFIANLLNPPIMITFGLFCGVTIPRPAMPKFWQAWLNPLDPMSRLVNGMMSTELHDLQVVCAQHELAIFNPPSGQSCGEFAGTFLKTAIGYLSNPNSTSDCGYCQFSVGDGYLATLEYYWSDRWKELGIFSVFIVSNLIILVIAARYLNYAKR